MKKTQQTQTQTQAQALAQRDFQLLLGALYLAGFCTCFYVLSII